MKTLTNEQAIQVQKLRKEGYSIRDIAAELGIKKYQVEAVVNQHRIIQQLPSAKPEPAKRTRAAGKASPTNDDLSGQIAEERERLQQWQEQIEYDRAVLNAEIRAMQQQQRTLASQGEAVEAATLQYGQKLRDIQSREQRVASDRRELDSRQAKLSNVSGSVPSSAELQESYG